MKNIECNPNLPYSSLPLLPPKEEVETKRILKKAISANKALAGLKGSGKNIPNQTVLLNAISLQEAKLSSEIENIVTTNDALYKAFGSESKTIDNNTKEVIHYQDALWQGYTELTKTTLLTTNLFVRLVNTIKENNIGIRKHKGTKIMNQQGKVIYTPPEGEDLIREKLHNLETFMNTDEDEIDYLIKMAIIHYQFEAIHPFADGNGRTGRILNILYLIKKELLDIPVLYLSKYIIEHKSDYYRLLKAVTEDNNWEDWIWYMLDAIEQMAIFTQTKIDSIYKLMTDTGESIKKKLPGLYSKDLVEVLFRLPYSKIKFLEEAGLGSRKTVSGYLSSLEEAGFLKSVKVGKERIFVNQPFYELLIKSK